MKKAIGIAVLAALIVSLSGCANTDHPQTIQDSSGIEVVTNEIDERTEPEESSSASFSESKESSADSTATVKAETELAQAENSQPTTEQSPTVQTQTPAPQTAVPSDTPKPETPKTVEPTPEPKPSPTQQPTPPPVEETPTPEPASAEPPQETPPPDEPAVPEFNIQTWIDYAKAYAVNVGLRLESSTVDCWDNPITAGAYSACLERDIQGWEVFKRIGINRRYEEWFITDYECPDSHIYDLLGEYEGLSELNYLANQMMELDESEDFWQAVLDLGENTGSVQELINLTENMDCFDYLSGVTSDYDLGYYWIEESGCYDTKALGSLKLYRL